MWFLFGFVTIAVAVCFEFWRRHESLWSPDGKHEGYDYKLLKSKNNTTGLLLGSNCVAGANFSIKRQSYFDAFCKRIGVSTEFETGDQAFDDAYYLATDNTALHQVLANNPKLRTAIDVIMRFTAGGFKTKAIYCRNGRIWIQFGTGLFGVERDIATVTRKLGHPLSVIVNVVADLSKAEAIWTDPFVIKAAILLAISSGLVINVAVQLIRHGFTETPFVVDYKEIIVDASLYALVIVPLVLLLAVYWLGRGARTHLVLIELGSIGAVALTLNLALEMRDINIEMDSRKHTSFKTSIVDKRISEGRRRSTNYYLMVHDWRCEDCGTYQIKVSKHTYLALPVGYPITIWQHKGYLGYPWVSDIVYS